MRPVHNAVIKKLRNLSLITKFRLESCKISFHEDCINVIVMVLFIIYQICNKKQNNNIVDNCVIDMPTLSSVLFIRSNSVTASMIHYYSFDLLSTSHYVLFSRFKSATKRIKRDRTRQEYAALFRNVKPYFT